MPEFTSDLRLNVNRQLSDLRLVFASWCNPTALVVAVLLTWTCEDDQLRSGLIIF
jgi:hypothetical protein